MKTALRQHATRDTATNVPRGLHGVDQAAADGAPVVYHVARNGGGGQEWRDRTSGARVHSPDRPMVMRHRQPELCCPWVGQ
jgi:hypothetical protein